MVELLLEKDASIGASTLSFAASGGHTGTVELLLSKGACVATGDGYFDPLAYHYHRAGRHDFVEDL